MIKLLQMMHPWVFVLIATTLETGGDAILRSAIYSNSLAWRMALMPIGALMLFGYGYSLNLAPVEFGRIVGLYIATLLVMWQIMNFLAFREVPTLPILVGGLFVVTGGLIIHYWKPNA